MKNNTLVLRDTQTYGNKSVLAFAISAKAFYDIEK